MSISNIRQSRYIAFWKPAGRVIAIHAVKPRIGAEKWQKEALLQTWWVHKSHACMPTYERARLLRTWYTMRAYRERERRRVRGDA